MSAAGTPTTALDGSGELVSVHGARLRLEAIAAFQPDEVREQRTGTPAPDRAINCASAARDRLGLEESFAQVDEVALGLLLAAAPPIGLRDTRSGERVRRRRSRRGWR